MNDTITVTVTTRNRGAGTHTTIVESPYAEALAVIDGLNTASNATYRGVRFGRARQNAMTPVLRVDYRSAEWQAILATGSGPYTFSREYLDTILAAAAAIEAVIAKAVPAARDHACAGAKDGCRARVAAAGAYCSHCQHDA